MNEKTVLAIDPGSSKCGMALVTRIAANRVQLLWRAVCPVGSVAENMDAAADVHPFDLLIMGSGTNSQKITEAIRARAPSIAILVIDEKDTTLQARERYWAHNKRRGWRQFLPATLQVPPEPVDDFVALILAERVLLSS